MLVAGAGLTACGGGGTASSGSSAATATVTTIFPNAAPAGALAFTLNVTGSNFASGSTVNWNGSSRTTTFVSSTQLQAHIMAADVASPGKATVTVVNTKAAPSSGITFTIAADTIAYQSNRALDGSDAANGTIDNIWVINPDGSGPAALTKFTAAGAFATQPVWSPDGSRIAFPSGGALDGSNAANNDSTSNIWVMKADGTGATPLTKLTALNSDCFAAAWSPDGSKIAFISGRALDGSDAANPNDIRNIWVMNADGSGVTPLTRITALALTTAPVWSPDGSKIGFASARALDGSNAANTTLNIWVMKADGSGLTALTKNTVGGNEEPVWSQDGSKIAFASHRALDGSDTLNSAENIWVMNADGSNAHPLTQVTAANSNSSLPAWSPDGSKLVFFSSRALDGSNASNTGATTNIWVINSDGSSPIPLTKNTASGISINPIWTPDGKVLYTSAAGIDGSNTDNIAENIWLINADGSNATPLTKITTTTVQNDLANQP